MQTTYFQKENIIFYGTGIQTVTNFYKFLQFFTFSNIFILYFTYFGFQYICYHIGADISSMKRLLN